MDILPVELWDMITDFLDLEELIRLKSVNKYFYSKTVNRKEAVFDLKKLSNSNIILSLNKNLLKKLTIKNGILKGGIIKKIIKKYRNLEDLNLINIESLYTSFIPISEALQIKNLDLSNTNSIYNYQLYLIGINCKKLEKIILKNQNKIDHHIILYMIDVHPSINYIDITDCEKIDKDFLSGWLENSSKKLKLIF
jgi:hypothetical protein